MSGWPSFDRADDERLARTLAAGDPSALIQVMDRYAARLYDYCHALLRDQEQAAGALHDALIAAYAHVPVLREPDRFRGWLYALVRKESMRRLRDPERPAERHEAPEVEEGFLDGAELAKRLEARQLVHSGLAALRGREREALDLMLRHGLDAGEVGGVLGMDAHEAADLTGRARARLDAALTAAHIVRNGGGCPEAAAIADEGGWPLPPPAVRSLAGHMESCPACAPQRDRPLSAARLLQVMPVATMPTDLRGHVMATATDPSLAGDLDHIAYHAGPFDTWGWPIDEDEKPAQAGPRRGAPRALWPVLAAVAAVVLIVAGAFFIMPGSPTGGTEAQDSPGPATSAPDSAAPSESEEPTESPTPTESSTPTPTPSTTTPTPTPTRTRSARPSSPRPSTTRPRAGTLLVGGCTISGAGPGACALPVRAVGGTVTWAVTGASAGLSASGGGTLANGRTAVVMVSGNCVPPGGSGTVSFSTGQSGSVTLACAEPEGSPGGPGR
ncbi:sigma-70 family RNA polymerase sigma factor [Actinomadura sp. 7K534]|uniref:sigma-70 family RNA polymerase sigma factor n=1 Tax=Actinomadura sp. 7K534 TaxID=2530366 RepID=UPI0010516582|nr:sigma-70 family RNA polymerase sigma factor [Actinomadura sp. 7K534]TDB93629.1 sigma-70 family RNA polymerase sigma factor [Actinomadura sp. 7K534]